MRHRTSPETAISMGVLRRHMKNRDEYPNLFRLWQATPEPHAAVGVPHASGKVVEGEYPGDPLQLAHEGGPYDYDGPKRGTGAILDVRGDDLRWESERFGPSVTPEDAMADGFMAYCTQDDNPYTDDALVRAWEQGFRTAEDFYEGEPCQEA